MVDDLVRPMRNYSGWKPNEAVETVLVAIRLGVEPVEACLVVVVHGAILGGRHEGELPFDQVDDRCGRDAVVSADLGGRLGDGRFGGSGAEPVGGGLHVEPNLLCELCHVGVSLPSLFSL